MKKIGNDPLLTIFKNTSKDEYIEVINSIENIPNFFTFISNETISETEKIGVLENFLLIIKKNRYICEFFSYFKNKSIYIYLFDIYLSEKSSEKLKTSIINLLNELILNLETNKDIYEYLFQSISKIYNIEKTAQEKTPLNLYNHLTLLSTILAYKDKIPKPRNYFASSGNGKFFLYLSKGINIGHCMTFIINFKIGEAQNEGISTLLKIIFSNNTSISFNLKAPSFLLIKEGNSKEQTIKALLPNEYCILVINLIIEDGNLNIYSFVNGENNHKAIKLKNNLNLTKDIIKSIDFFENFYGEITSMALLIQKEKANPTINLKEFLPNFGKYKEGFHKKKHLKNFLELLSNTPSNVTLNDKEKENNSSEDKLINNLVFIFTSFNYFHSSWRTNGNNCENQELNDYFFKYKIYFSSHNNSIRNHRYQYFQKNLNLVCAFTNFLPIAEMFLIHPQLLTETNLELYLQIIEIIINFRKRNVEVFEKNSFFEILCLFIQKFPNQIFTEKILDAFINLGKDMFKNDFVSLTNEYFENILLNEKILSKYSQQLQIKFWNQLFLFCESDREQLETFLKMNTICLILRFYDKNKYNEMCCKNHLDMFKKEFNDQSNIMNPSMEEKLIYIWKIIDLIINSQKPKWILSLFKLLMLDLSPCLTKFIITSIIKALIRHEKYTQKKGKIDNKLINEFITFQSMIIIDNGNFWLKEFMQEMKDNNYETIIINTFIHSLPDVQFEILKLFYQIYQSLVSLNQKDDFKNFFKMMKKYLLPQNMFYEKGILVLDENIYKQNLQDIIVFFIYWALDEILIEIKDEITFGAKNDLEKDSIIINTEIFEIIFDLIKQSNYDIEITIKFLEILSQLTKNPFNCNTLLNNYKIFLMLLDFIYECYKLKLKNVDKNKDIENCFSLGKTIISNVYINNLIYNEKNLISDNYSFNEISLIFLWGDKIIFKSDYSKAIEFKNDIFTYIRELLMRILTEFKLKIFPKMNINISTNNIKNNFLKSYYHQNYLIFMYKLFEFSFEFILDSLIKTDQLVCALPSSDVMSYYNLFLTSMKIDDSKGNSINLYWNDYLFFEEIYLKVKYIWTKEYYLKDYEKAKSKNPNKVKKYEDILENIILDKEKRNKFKNELEFLCTYYAKEKEYNFFGEQEETESFDSVLNITLIKQIQIALIGMINVILAKQNKCELLKWLKELKHFTIFLIIASSNFVINEKENKDLNEKKVSKYINLQDQCLLAIYNSLNFLFQLRSLSSICKDKIDKICVNVFTLTFVILRNAYNYRKKHRISKRFSFGYKIHDNDLSSAAIFLLFNDYIKDKSKEKGDNILITLDKLNSLLDENNYAQNIIKLLEDKNWNNSFYDKNKNINDILSEYYFPIMEYKSVVEKRIKTINKLEEKINNEKDNWEYSSNDILKLLPTYEKELIQYSNNSLEKNIRRKNMYKIIKKNNFSWRGYWSNRTLFYQDDKIISNKNNNDDFADKDNVSKIKYKLINHYTKSLMKPLLAPILDIHYYLPDFTGFDPATIFNNKDIFIVNMDIDKIMKVKEEQKKEGKTILKDNYLREIYIKSNPLLVDKLLKISDSLDFGKEEEFSVFKEDKYLRQKTQLKKEDNKIEDNNKNENNHQEEEEQKNYYLCCLVKCSHHIKGVCFVDDDSLNFKVFLNQKTGNAMSGVNIGFTDKDEDYDEERKTCFGSFFMFHQKDKNLYKISINYEDINLILFKRYYYKNSALEIFTIKNKSYYFNFKFEEDRQLFINNIISKFKEPKTIINDYIKDITIGYGMKKNIFRDKKKYNKKEKEKKDKIEKKTKFLRVSKIVNDWTKWKINNFTFLMWMNFYGNRSYNDISQYPIFPWILSDYNDPLKIEPDYFETSLNKAHTNENGYYQNKLSNISNISDKSINSEKKKKKKKEEEKYNYRELKLPMGMLEINEESKKRKEDFIELFNNIKKNKDEFEGIKPYFYGTNYSNPIYVCNFLMRLFPFTHISIELQGNKMDDPNRLFLSVIKSFNNSISQKTDIRELIPEFFYMPEMYLNINDINLGKQENNSIVYNVITPCENNSYSFTEIMKRIFENGKISTNLNNWVDIIFGYKVKGKDAENAKNVYTEASYQEIVNLDKVEEKSSFLRSVEFGLIPSQVLNKECPKRELKKNVGKEIELTEYNMNNINKIKIVEIKHDNSNDKNMNNEDGTKSKILKAEIINNDRVVFLYDNNTIIENKINNSNEDINCVSTIKSFENKIDIFESDKINHKFIKFCNFGKILVMGGFYDGRLEIIYIEDKTEIDRKILYPLSEEDPILSVCINNDETFMILGNTMGNIAVFEIDIENNEWNLYKKIDQQMNAIANININNELNMFGTCSKDGFVNLYTLPLCKLIRSIKVPIDKEKDDKCNYIFLSESSLPSIIIITEDEKYSNIFSYSINGQFLNKLKADRNIDCISKIRDLNSFEYLIYYSKSQIIIRNLPNLSMQFVINNINNVKSICINEDISAIYTFNEDGTQIQAIRD